MPARDRRYAYRLLTYGAKGGLPDWVLRTIARMFVQDHYGSHYAREWFDQLLAAVKAAGLLTGLRDEGSNGTCPRCGHLAELSDGSRSGRPGFWSEPLCSPCRAALGSTTVDKLSRAIGWIAMPVEKLLDLADGFHGGQVRQ